MVRGSSPPPEWEQSLKDPGLLAGVISSSDSSPALSLKITGAHSGSRVRSFRWRASFKGAGNKELNLWCQALIGATNHKSPQQLEEYLAKGAEACFGLHAKDLVRRNPLKLWETTWAALFLETKAHSSPEGTLQEQRLKTDLDLRSFGDKRLYVKGPAREQPQVCFKQNGGLESDYEVCSS